MTPTRNAADQQSAGDRQTFDAIIDAAVERLGRNQRVRRNLPGGGRLRVDRQLPFLCVYRQAPDEDDAGTREFVTTQAAYLFASGEPRYHPAIGDLCQRISGVMQEHFGTFLFLEVWAQEIDERQGVSRAPAAPEFEVVTPDPGSLPSTLDAFTQALSEISVNGRRAIVNTSHSDSISPPGLAPLTFVPAATKARGCCALGVAIRPIYRDAVTGHLFPLVLESLRGQFARALRKAIARFTGLESESKHVHYDSLGPSSLVKAARMIDQELCEVAESFDFLLQATPTNRQQAWQEFSDSNFQRTPELYYRPLPYHPSHLKRRLFRIEIERIEDPTLAHLFWEKQIEVDRQLSALRDLNTREFLFNSLQLYGGADRELVDLAQAILDKVPLAADSRCQNGLVHADEIVAKAREEIDYYFQKMDAFDAKVEVCDNIAAGTMVSQDRLLIATDIRLPPERVEPLMHHEIGTHLLTYFNGCCQRFRQLYSGLAGYEELQEGLAVLAEYLCGGLTTNRLRTLAGRVIAVRAMLDGASFPATFARLHEECGFPPWPAFVTTFRVHRGGGLTKDAIYLRGLRDLLRYLGKGHEIEPLYVGKIGLRHVPFLQEMRRRGVIRAPSVLPRLWDDERMRERLERCRGLTVPELLEIIP